MKQKELLVPLYLKNGRAVTGLENMALFTDGDAVRLAKAYDNAGADALLVFDLSKGDEEHDASIGLIKSIARAVDIPLYGGGNIRRMEDVKKLIYAGCRKVFLNFSREANEELAHEVSGRFGREKILACVRTEEELAAAGAQAEILGGAVLLERSLAETWAEKCKERDTRQDLTGIACCMSDSLDGAGMRRLLETDGISGICASDFMVPEYDIMGAKHGLLDKGIPVNTY